MPSCTNTLPNPTRTAARVAFPANMVKIDKQDVISVEERRLREDNARTKYWKKYGPYVAERQWSTVREDYS